MPGCPRVLAAATLICLLGLPSLLQAAPTALGPNEALVLSRGTVGVISILDLATGQARELPAAPVAIAPPMIVSRQSFAWWQGGDSSPIVLWLLTLGKAAPVKLYEAPAGWTVVGSAWWPARYCFVASLREGDKAHLVLISPQGQSREVAVKYDQGPGKPTLALSWAGSLVGLGDDTHLVADTVGQALRCVIDVTTGRAKEFGQDWRTLPAVAWPWQANLYWQGPRLNRSDGRLYGTVLSYVWSDQGAHTPELQEMFIQALTKASGIYSCRPDGTDLRRVSVPPSMGIGTNRFPVLVDLSPDGRQLLFTYYDYGVKGYAVPGLYVCKLDGSGSRAVPGEGQKLSTGAWGG